MRRFLLILLGVSSVVHAGIFNITTIYCPVPPKEMKPEFFTLSEKGMLATMVLKDRPSDRITHVSIRSEQYILDKDIIKNTLSYSPNNRLRTARMMLGCNRCSYDSPYRGISFSGCIA